jgi:hypothetical protein
VCNVGIQPLAECIFVQADLLIHAKINVNRYLLNVENFDIHSLSHDLEMLLQIHQPNVEVLFLFPATYEAWTYQDITLEIYVQKCNPY